jgi:hypothetical protein
MFRHIKRLENMLKHIKQFGFSQAYPGMAGIQACYA